MGTRKNSNEPRWEQLWKTWQGHVTKLLNLFDTHEPHVAFRRAKKLQNRVTELEEIIQQFVIITKTDNHGNALTRMEAIMNSPHQIALAKLPKALCKPPVIWMNGIPAKHGHPGLPPMTPTDAQRTHRLLLPWIVEAWQVALDDGERGEKAQAELLEEYENVDPKTFERRCYAYINDVDLEIQTSHIEKYVDKEPTVSELTALLKLTTPYTYEKQQRGNYEGT